VFVPDICGNLRTAPSDHHEEVSQPDVGKTVTDQTGR
jgi:hypothetical protein